MAKRTTGTTPPLLRPHHLVELHQNRCRKGEDRANQTVIRPTTSYLAGDSCFERWLAKRRRGHGSRINTQPSDGLYAK